MPVPEASVYEDARAVLCQDEVGGTGETFLGDAISVSKPKQCLAQLYFRLGVTGPDVRHAGVALRRRDGVGHDSVLLSFVYSAFYAGLRVWHFPAEMNVFDIYQSIL